jgi:predicted restriction endonuclease
MTNLDSFDDEQFSEIILTSSTWKDLSYRFGYVYPMSSNVKTSIKKRCKDLMIPEPQSQTKTPISIQTKGDLFKNRKNWQSARSSITRLARKSFMKSNKPYRCEICGYTNHVEVAHIKPVSEFSDDTPISEINNPDNLIGLCPNHHWEFDNGLLKL